MLQQTGQERMCYKYDISLPASWFTRGTSWLATGASHVIQALVRERRILHRGRPSYVNTLWRIVPDERWTGPIVLDLSVSLQEGVLRRGFSMA